MSGRTSKNTWATKKSHVNVVVADTETWEQLADKCTVRLIIEVISMNKDKAKKKWAVEKRRLPAVNRAGTCGRWDFVEVSEDILTVKNQLAEKLSELTAKSGDDWNVPRPDEDDAVAGAFIRAQESSMRRFWQETGHDNL